jgi:hypothetical protein
MYHSYVEIEYVATSFSPARTDLALKLLSTVCLLRALFEDLGCAIELHEKIANEDTELHSLDPRN